MPDPTLPAAQPPAAQRFDAGDLHLVLFGMPAAGKSSLLGALARAAQAQAHLLGAKRIARPPGLADLRTQLYAPAPGRTADEVVPYAVRYEPVTNGQNKQKQPIDAVLMDCDGRVANDLVVRRKTLDEDSP